MKIKKNTIEDLNQYNWCNEPLGSSIKLIPLCYNRNNGKFGSCGSSIRYKEDISPLKLGLETIKKLQPATYTWKESGEEDFGFVAEEVEAINPLLVTHTEGIVEGVKYSQLTAILVNAIKELEARVETLENK
tara:strand:- start:1007 stop:1402 length:396 start_codon:yes stop_codon:yes gene_type:complete